MGPAANQPAFGSPQGGSLVGPNHPMFRDPQNLSPEGYPQYYPGFGGMYPRFDPLGPIVGPNNDIDFGLDLLPPGAGMIPGRGLGGRFAGRGRGRHNNFPGEPGPDHLRPPGW